METQISANMIWYMKIRQIRSTRHQINSESIKSFSVFTDVFRVATVWHFHDMVTISESQLQEPLKEWQQELSTSGGGSIYIFNLIKIILTLYSTQFSTETVK